MSSSLNLLPPARRTALLLGLRYKQGKRVLMSLIIGLLIVSFTALLSWAALVGIMSALPPKSGADFDRVLAEYKTVRDSAIQQNSIIDQMKMVTEDRVVWSEKIHDLLSIIPQGIQIGSIRTIHGEHDTLVFSGRSATRGAIIILGQRLPTLPWAASVDSPNANLLDRANAQYEFSIAIK